MHAELFYLVGKSNTLKQTLVSQLKDELAQSTSVFIPEVYTTDALVAEGENYIYLDERDFHLRHSMGIYCLSWEKNKQHYGVVADVIQRLNTGVDVILNGSMHNLEQATNQFVNLNTVLIQKQGARIGDTHYQYLIAEDDEVRLEWSDQGDMGHPYVLTLESDKSVKKAVTMLLSLVTYDRHFFHEVS